MPLENGTTKRDQRPASTMPPELQSPNEYKSSSSWLTRGTIAFGSIGLLILVVFLLQQFFGKPKVDNGMTHTIARGDLVVTVTEQGTLESSNNTEVKSKVRGFNMVTWVVEVGTVVKKGDELVRLDTKAIEENLSLNKTNVHTARATLERTKADVAKAEIALEAYKSGRFNAQKQVLEQAIEIAERRLARSKEIFDRSNDLFLKGFMSKLELEADEFLVTQNELELSIKKTELAVLMNYTKEMELATLGGEVTATKSKLQADDSGLKMDESRLQRVNQELEDCVITAPRDGLVIYPSAAEWKATPDISEGATVRMDQVLLLMPDLEKMQVKVGVHESIIDRLDVGCEAKVTLTDREINAKVSSVANVTKPAGWWTGNVVKYDTIIELPVTEGLKPGMSAEVEIVLAKHKDVLTIPVAAVVETDRGSYCWIATPDGPKRKAIELGDTNDVFIVVKEGLAEGDQVVMNPLAHVDEAQDEIQSSLDDEASFSKP